MIRAFTEGYGSLAQLALRRIDAVRATASS
jgi:hypothetical protein